MLRSLLRTGSVAALLAGAVGTAAAQVPPPAPAPAGTAPQAYRVKAILGTKVHIQGDVSIGIVEDMVFDDNGTIEYLVVANDGKLVTVPWQAAKFNFEQRTATLNITQQQFQAIPTYTTTQYPNYYTPAYRTEVYRYYGLTPGQQRRLDRRLER